MCNYFNNFTDNVCCPTTIWMCDEADKECFNMKNNSQTKYKEEKPFCVKCYYCLFPIGLAKDIFCFPFKCLSEYYCCYEKYEETIEEEELNEIKNDEKKVVDNEENNEENNNKM